MSMDSPLLSVEKLDASYGDLQVLWGVSLEVMNQEIVALVGTNGAGKSTLLRCISGLFPPGRGTIYYGRREITSIPAHERVRLGIVLIPEERGIFPDLSVEHNLRIGGYTLGTSSLFDSLAWVYDLFPVLRQRKNQMARSLSGGEQQMLAIGKGLISKPKLLMLDEPSLGLAPLIIARLLDLITKIHQENVTILLVDQNVRHALKISKRAYIIENGRIVLEGSTEALLDDPRTKKAFLGR